MDSKRRQFRLSHPPQVSPWELQQFLKKSESWGYKQIPEASLQTPYSWSYGGEIPLFGTPTPIHQGPHRRIEFREGILYAGCDENVLPQRLESYLRKRALIELESRTLNMARIIGVSVKGVRLQDCKTRWGSCSWDGVIRYSWRVIMAPKSVMDYLVAHEVSHRLHMNHSKDFWTIVHKLHPDPQTSKKWLKVEGKSLFF